MSHKVGTVATKRRLAKSLETSHVRKSRKRMCENQKLFGIGSFHDGHSTTEGEKIECESSVAETSLLACKKFVKRKKDCHKKHFHGTSV